MRTKTRFADGFRLEVTMALPPSPGGDAAAGGSRRRLRLRSQFHSALEDSKEDVAAEDVKGAEAVVAVDLATANRAARLGEGRKTKTRLPL